MLSRLSLHVGNPVLAKNAIIKFIPCVASATSSSSSSAPADPCERPSTATMTSSGGKRDLVNFPDRVRLDYPPPTRFGFIPETFFQALYPKTGVTGPYMLFFGVGTYMLSKEILVVEHNFTGLLSWICLCTFVNYKFGDKIAAAWTKMVDEEDRKFNQSQEDEKEACRNQIKYLEELKNVKEVVGEIMKAKREGIMLQMEAAYRQRLQEAYKKVKSRLDCQVELDYVERRIAHMNLHDYVLRNVMKSITPELENNTLQKCIADLNTLAAKA